MNYNSRRLELWLEANKVNQSGLAAMLQVTRAAVSYYVKGHRIPKVEIAKQIALITGGMVPASDWPAPRTRGPARPREDAQVAA